MNSSSEMISKLMEENTKLQQRSIMLDQLLYAVSIVHPNETRFETALRYIRTMEKRECKTESKENSRWE